MKIRHKALILILTIGLIVRFVLPYATKVYIESELNKQKNFHVSIEDVDYSFIRGAIQIENTSFKSTNEEDQFFANFSRLEVDLDYWKSLINWRIVSSGFLDQPNVKYIMDLKSRQKEDNRKKGVRLRLKLYQIRKLLAQIIPFQVESFEIYNGRITYKTPNEPIEFELSSVDFELKQLTNEESTNAVAKLSAVSTGQGKIDANLEFDPDARNLEFDLDAQLRNLKLKSLNPIFKKFASLDVAGGEISVFIEASAKDKKFEAYVKPLIKDLDILSDEDLKDENLFGLLWEGIAGLIGNILENHSEDQLGAKIKFEGNLDQPDADIWQAIESILTNAFVKALAPQLEWEIDFI